MVFFSMGRRAASVVVTLCSIVSSSNAFMSTQHRQERNPTFAAVLPSDESNEGPTRREAIQFGALALSSLLVPGTLPAPAYASEPKTIVLTGK